MIKDFGLTLSVGKSYFSKDFLTVNSKLYLCKKGPEPFKLQSFFNPAQLLPSHYLTSGHGKSDSHCSDRYIPDDFVSRLSDALQRTTDHRFVFGAWSFFNRKLLDKVTKGGRLNLYIHQKLGGLGVKPAKDQDIFVCDHQLRTAHYLKRRVFDGIAPNKLLQVKKTKSTSLLGLQDLGCVMRPVRATVEPKPKGEQTFLNHIIQESEEEWDYKIRTVWFPPQEPKLSVEESMTSPWKLEISPTEENNMMLNFPSMIGWPCSEGVELIPIDHSPEDELPPLEEVEDINLETMD